jgi:hypothetical protein
MSIGSSRILRRVDTDFVNLTPIAFYLNATLSAVVALPSSTVINQGSFTICGAWAPLAEAKAFVQQHPSPGGEFDVFLSNLLFERFPSALQDFHRSNTRGRLSNRFGPPFQSTVEAKWRTPSHRQDVPLHEAITPWEQGMVSHRDMEGHLLSVHPSLALVGLSIRGKPENKFSVEAPLSPSEQEIFQTLLDLSDWDAPTQASTNASITMTSDLDADAVTLMDLETEEEQDVEAKKVTKTVHRRRRSTGSSRDRPLRRSKRVANAIAARSRTRLNKRGSRSSFS